MKDIKHKNGIIRVQKNNFKGVDYIDVRKFYLKEETGEWLPTRKGISIPLEITADVVKAINEVI